VRGNKKTLFAVSVMAVLLLFTFHTAFAGNYSSAADPGGFNNPVLVTDSITAFLEAVMVHLQGIIAFLAVMFIVIGGILYMTAGGNQTMITTAKVCVTSSIIGLALAAAGPSFLRQIQFSVYGAVGGPIPININLAPTVGDIVERVLTFLLSIAGILGIIGLTISGLLYIFATGDSSQATKAKEAMKYSVIGIAIAGAALIIVKQVVLFLT